MPQLPTKHIERPPVVAVMGHIDHGKSTLLDYIRSTNIVDKEAGGITQHVSAYEVIHKEGGAERKITFLDTPGHAAFSNMRERGVEIADIGILVVSAEDGVKAQTLEALKQIIDQKLPYIVAINKIDKPNANIERTKMSLVENGVYLEGMGGSISYVPISAKIGTGVNELLSTVLLAADLAELKGNPNESAEGYVLESSMEARRGTSATLIIKNGTIKKGAFVVAGTALAPFRIVEDFLGKPLTEATCSSPIRVTGWDEIPKSGTLFQVFYDKKEAEEAQRAAKEAQGTISKDPEFIGSKNAQKVIPLVLKADVAGTLDAVKQELRKIKAENLALKIISVGVGPITENDVLLASSDPLSVVIGFHTKLEPKARDQIERLKVKVEQFDIIYKLTEWLAEYAEIARPREETDEVIGTLKVLRIFSQNKDKQVVGGKVLTGVIRMNHSVKIIRREHDLGRGKITELQSAKVKTNEVLADTECGLLVESKTEIAIGDTLECFIKVTK